MRQKGVGFIVGGLVFFFLGMFSEASAATGDNFTRNTEVGEKYGVQEIVITGTPTVSNAFDASLMVSFTPPSGSSVSVKAFYDGNNTWRARVYLNNQGNWSWSLTSSSGISGASPTQGAFTVDDSSLRGIMKASSQNNKIFATDNGRTFLGLGDTAYFFFNSDRSQWQTYAQDLSSRGVTFFRADFPKAPNSWNDYWTDSDRRQYYITNFQNFDARLQWLFNNYPHLYIQLKLFPGPNEYNTDDLTWQNYSSDVRNNTLAYILARLSAYPNIFFEITNDTNCTSSFPGNQFMARNVGQYFQSNDPWKHLMSYGPTRDQAFCFSSESWASYISAETSYDLAADLKNNYSSVSKPVLAEEDYYESSSNKPSNPAYFYRRQFWAWIISGGSVVWGGDYLNLTPYDQTSFTGLHGLLNLGNYFTSRNLDLALFTPDDSFASLVSAPTPEGNSGPSRAQSTHRGIDEYLVYIPNANDGESSGFDQGTISTREQSRQTAALNTSQTSQIDITLPSGTFSVEWFRPDNASVLTGNSVNGGTVRLTSPWSGTDVIVRLLRTSQIPTTTPTRTPTPTLTPTLQPTATPLPADFNNDNKVDGKDVILLFGQWLKSSQPKFDLILDDKINSLDFSAVLKSWKP